MLRKCVFCFRYHEANEKARAKVLELLRGLSTELQSKINVLVFASMMLVIAKALLAHVRLGMHRVACSGLLLSVSPHAIYWCSIVFFLINKRPIWYPLIDIN